MKSYSLTAILGLFAVGISPLSADSDRVQLPDNYTSTFVRYTSLDKPSGDRPAKVRFFYVNPTSLATAQPGQPFPSGTVLIMEDRKIQLDKAGKPVLDSSGRFIPSDDVTNIFVQEKRHDWGQAYPQDIRNGDWEYAWFLADGSRKTDADLNNCFACHKGAADNDYTFTFAEFVKTLKQPATALSP